MKAFRWRAGSLIALVAGGAAICLSMPRAAAQFGAPIAAAQWMLDSDLCGAGCDFAIGDVSVAVPLQNRYLTLWVYEGTSEDTKFSLWTNAGDPLNPNDDFGYVVDIDDSGNRTYVSPWGTRIWCSDRGEATDRPFGNLVTVRVDDPAAAATGGFRDFAFPAGAAQFAPNRPLLPLAQGYFQPFVITDGVGTLRINQKLTFVRDLLRCEYEVTNVSGPSRRVGIRLLQNPYPESGSAYIPESRQRVFFESDFGTATGTGVTPPRRPDFPEIPSTVESNDNIESANPFLRVKCIVRGPGVTTPTRLVIGNSLSMYGSPGVWDYSVEGRQELRLSDIGLLLYYDPIIVPAGQRRSFVNYVGMGVASHVFSNAFLLAQNFQDNLPTQGYVGAVQAPEATALINGNSDFTNPADPGTPITIPVDAYLQNEFHASGISNAFAFIDVPDGLQFVNTNPDQSQQLDIGSLTPVGSGTDEGQVRWTLQATGVEAGILNINVAFNHGFDDATRVTRPIHVPQGTRYQLGPGRNWRFLTMPFSYVGNQNDPGTALGLPAGTFQIVRFNPATNQYEQVSRLDAGLGYWVRSLNLGANANQFVRLQNAVPTRLSPRENFIVRVVRGWNMLGNPTPYAVPVSELRVVGPGGTLLTFDQAVASGLIRPGLFQHNRRTNQYDQVNREDVIQPGRGVWVFSNGERSVVFPAPVGTGISITP